MKKIEAIIERAKDGTFSVYCTSEMYSGFGETAEAAKKDMLQQMEFYKKTAKEEGFSYPVFLNEDFRLFTIQILKTKVRLSGVEACCRAGKPAINTLRLRSV